MDGAQGLVWEDGVTPLQAVCGFSPSVRPGGNTTSIHLLVDGALYTCVDLPVFLKKIRNEDPAQLGEGLSDIVLVA
jgi:hypothetical protein